MPRWTCVLGEPRAQYRQSKSKFLSSGVRWKAAAKLQLAAALLAFEGNIQIPCFHPGSRPCTHILPQSCSVLIALRTCEDLQVMLGC